MKTEWNLSQSRIERKLMKWWFLILLLLPSTTRALSMRDLSLYIQANAAESQQQPVGLFEAYQKALKNNERIAGAQEGYLQSVYLRRQVKSVLLPDITLQGVYFQQERIDTSGFAGQSFLIPHRRTYYAEIEQTLFNGFRERNGLKATNSLIQASQENLRQEKNDLLVDVAEAFFDALTSQREIETLEDSLKLQRQRWEEVTARQKVGLARRTDLLLIETQVASDEARLLRAQNALRVAREKLNFVVGEPVEGDLHDDVEEVIPSLEPDQLVSKARGFRADVKEAEWQVLAAQGNVSVIRGEYWPKLELTSNLYAHREGIQSPVRWDVEVSLKLPLFVGTDVRPRELEALSKLRQAELNKQQLSRKVDLDVRSAMLDWQSSDALIQSLQKQVDLAQENYDANQEQYRLGLATNLEVLTAYNFLRNAKLDLEKESTNRKLLWIRLQNALGENPLLEGK